MGGGLEEAPRLTSWLGLTMDVSRGGGARNSQTGEFNVQPIRP